MPFEIIGALACLIVPSLPHLLMKPLPITYALLGVMVAMTYCPSFAPQEDSASDLVTPLLIGLFISSLIGFARTALGKP